MSLRVAIVGTGMIANAGHIPAWRSLGEDAVVVAVHNRTLGKAERTASRHGIPKAYDDLAAMLGETKPDVVSVCTPNVSHDGIVRECLDAGCHVVCEKPLTTEYDSAVALFERAEAVGRKLVVAQTLRFTAQIRAAFDIASTGALGEVYYAEAGALRRRGIPTWGTFHIKEESGGGPLFDLGVHMLDSMLWIMGNPRVVSASGATYQKLGNQQEGLVTSLADSGAPTGVFDPRPFDPREFSVEDLGAGMLRLENGGTILLRAGWAANVPEGFARPIIVGTEAGMTLDPLRIVGRTGSYQSDTEPKVPSDPDVPFYGHHRLARHVLELVRGDAQPIVKPEEVLNVMGALTALYRSAKSGRQESVG